MWNSNAVKDEFMGQVVLSGSVNDPTEPQRLQLTDQGRQMPGTIGLRIVTSVQLTAIWPEKGLNPFSALTYLTSIKTSSGVHLYEGEFMWAGNYGTNWKSLPFRYFWSFFFFNSCFYNLYIKILFWCVCNPDYSDTTLWETWQYLSFRPHSYQDRGLYSRLFAE